MMTQKSQIEFKALKGSMYGALVLAVWGIGMGIYTSSGAIMLDGMFNLVSACMTLLSLKVASLIRSKETKDFPIGYYAFEPLFVTVKGVTILLIIIVALYSNIEVMLEGGRDPELGIMTLYVALAVVGCFGVYFYIVSRNKVASSEILVAECKGWFFNAMITLAIGIAFIIAMCIQNTSLGWICRYVDQILVIILSLAMIKPPFKMVWYSLAELLMAAPEQEITTQYEQALLSLNKQLDIEVMDFNVFKTGRRRWLFVYVTLNNNTVSQAEYAAFIKSVKTTAAGVYSNTETTVILWTGKEPLSHQ